MSHGKVRDRFDTALRLSAQAEGVQLPDLREEMRPKSKSEVRDLEWQRSNARERIGEACAEETITASVDRLLGHFTEDAPTDFDFAIVAEMDDGAIDEFTWGEADRTRIRMLRDQAWATR